jgi:hypothetical protein
MQRMWYIYYTVSFSRSFQVWYGPIKQQIFNFILLWIIVDLLNKFVEICEDLSCTAPAESYAATTVPVIVNYLDTV